MTERRKGIFGAPMRRTIGPYDAPWRDNIAQSISQAVGRVGGNERAVYRGVQKALSLADWLPGVGDAATAADAVGSFRSGNYIKGTAQTALATIGLFPGVGDVAAIAGKGALAKYAAGAAPIVGKKLVPAAQEIERVLYRGTNGSKEKIKGGIAEGTPFAARERMYAELYGDNIEQIGVRKGAKILKEGTGEFKKVTGRRHGMLIRGMRPGENMATAGTDAVARAKAAGYDGVEFHSGEDGIALINPAMFHRDYK